MELNEYLRSSRAVEDVRKFLAQKPLRCWASEPSAFWWVPRGDHRYPWRAIELQHVPLNSKPPTKNLNVYYRPSEFGFTISDCGESVSDLIRRTGLESEAAQDRVHQICEDGISLDDVNAPGLDVFAIRCQCKADRLAESIVAVLSVVARVREAS